ncbi:MAG: hypothetical protein J6S21_06595, partial [Victivallales bacterium]|nr:hypothetical protein [Victivallales bacterium]
MKQLTAIFFCFFAMCAMLKASCLDNLPDGPPLPGFLPGFKVDYSKPSAAKNYDLSKHPHFTKWTDPDSGIVSYILTNRMSPVQKPMYFTNRSISPNGEYLVFYTHFPP